MRALVIAYYFPPLGGGGVQRMSAFVRHLPDCGVEPIVVAGPAGGSSRWAPQDPKGPQLDASIYRPEGLPDLVGSRWKRLLGRPSAIEAWWARALVEPAERAIAAEKPDVLFVTLSPFAALEPVLELGRQTGLPVVADLRDPWALDEMQVYPSRWHRAREVARMGALLARADHVIWNTPEAFAAARRELPALDPERASMIPNGYDHDDFREREPRRTDGAFRLVHTGTLHSAFGFRHRERGALRRALGGTACEVDFLSRSHFYLLEALRRLAARGVDLSRLELHLLGVLSDRDRDLLESACPPLAPEQIRTPGYSDHATTVRAQLEADLLFLPMHALPEGRRARIVPGKTYEYLASGRPLLAAVPEGDARDLVLAERAGDVVAPGDVDAMAASIEARLEQPSPPTRAISTELERFERRRLTADLKESLRRAIGRD